jgi:deoxyribodipyrimidine photo-lyase
MTPKRIIHWFRRDLRLDDNTALSAACVAADEVVPVFIFDRAILTRPDTGATRVAFLLDALRDLDESLKKCGGALILREGDPEVELEKLAIETGAEALHFNRDVEPFARARDRRVADRLADRLAVRTFEDAELHAPDALRTKTGGTYTVFTPYKRAALALPVAPSAPAPAVVRTPRDLASRRLPTLAELGFAPADAELPVGGETPGAALLHDFATTRLAHYAARRDFPAVEGSSRLSPYLKFGCVSVRRAYWSAEAAAAPTDDARAGADTWISELLWRDFYRHILFHFPHVETGAFKRGYDALKWENDDERFARWRAGRTGFPIVDAGMRQLAATGWMHNRVRMIVASFLTKDLLIDWRRGERHFMQLLVDGDLAANNGGWQWAASTGTDAQPYFRIFNPISQGQKFDPKGDYVRRYVPELRSVPEKWIHAPWETPRDYQKAFRCVIGTDYPAPVVDHARQRVKALELFKQVKP